MVFGGGPNVWEKITNQILIDFCVLPFNLIYVAPHPFVYVCNAKFTKLIRTFR